MNQSQRGFTIYELIVATVALAAFGGWVANIVKFVGLLDGAVTAMFIARGAGIIAAPLGAILGYL